MSDIKIIEVQSPNWIMFKGEWVHVQIVVGKDNVTTYVNGVVNTQCKRKRYDDAIKHPPEYNYNKGDKENDFIDLNDYCDLG
jgi:hypothetical protein